MINPLDQRSTPVLENELERFQKISKELESLLPVNTPSISSAKQTIFKATAAIEKELTKRNQI